MLYGEEYRALKTDLLKKKTRPYIMHNKDLAAAFFSRLKTEVPTAKIRIEPGRQVITYDEKAERRLEGEK